MSMIQPQVAPPAPPPPVDLNVRRIELQREQLALEAAGCPPDPTKSEAENAAARRAFDDRMRKLILEQLTILASLRKTSTGPARAGGKRAKRAPLDLEALENQIFSA